LKNIFTHIALILMLVFAVKTAHGQLVTVGNQSPQQLVQNVLLGGGVTVSNIQYQGAAAAIGYFNGEGCNIGLNEGIILTTGTIFNTGVGAERYGPHGPNDRTNAGVDNNQPGYGLLTNIVGTPTFNATVLSFDFIPYADIVEFRYVFASEEYPEYVGSQFNDVFGFFISGPGVGNNVNIARIPGSNQPVAINNVNAGSNSAFFVNNGTGTTAPQNSSPFYVQYDGFTTVLTARSNVVCGETYRIIIAIADVGDGIFDSGIFLEANSFSSPVDVDISYQLSSLAYDNDYTMAEGCTSATVSIERPQHLANTSLTIPISVSGTATMGVDYSATIPISITLAPGQTATSFTIEAFADDLVEGIETILIDFGIPDPCGNNDFIRVKLAIDDVAPVQVTVPDVVVVCPGQEVTLFASPSGGGDGYNFTWNTGETTQSITVSPEVTTTYNVTVSDNCLGQTVVGTGQVIVPVYDELLVIAQSDIVTECPFTPHTFVAEASGGAGDYAFIWKNEDGFIMGTGPTLTVTPSVSSWYSVTALDLCNNEANDTVYYTITSPPLFPFVRLDTLICYGDSVLLEASGTGGFGEKFFYWPHSGETTPSVWVTPNTTTTYTVEVSDECGTFVVSASATVSVSRVYADYEVSSTLLFEDVPITFENTSQNTSIYQWVFSTGYQSNLTHAQYTFNEAGTYYVTLFAENEIGCRDSITKPIYIRPEHYIYVPNTFTPDGNRMNEFFRVSTVNIIELQIAIFNRWGEAVFTANDVDFTWDGTYQGLPVNDGTYIYRIEYRTIDDETGKLTGHVNVLR
jgi:gliding motility-associated-like protein